MRIKLSKKSRNIPRSGIRKIFDKVLKLDDVINFFSPLITSGRFESKIIIGEKEPFIARDIICDRDRAEPIGTGQFNTAFNISYQAHRNVREKRGVISYAQHGI
jgi:hypothetical protein